MSREQDQKRIGQLVELILAGDVRDERKERFHREAKWVLRAMARILEVPLADYKVLSNVAGPAVSGYVTLTCATLFVSMSADQRNLGVLFRRANKADPFGVQSENHWIPWLDLASNFEACVRRIRHVMRHSDSWIPAARTSSSSESQ